MSRVSSIITALALAIVGPTFSVAPAHAVMMPAAPGAIVGSPPIEEVRHRVYRGRHIAPGGPNYDGYRHHRRYGFGGYGHRRHYGGGFGLYGAFPFAFGNFGYGGFGYGDYGYGGYGYGGYAYGDDWRTACSRKYRSFNWNTGLYLGYDGRYHQCRL